MATKQLTIPQKGDWVEVKKPRKGRSFLKKGSVWQVEETNLEKQCLRVVDGYKTEYLWFDEIIPSSAPLVEVEEELNQSSSDPAWDDPDSIINRPRHLGDSPTLNDLGDSSTLNECLEASESETKYKDLLWQWLEAQESTSQQTLLEYGIDETEFVKKATQVLGVDDQSVQAIALKFYRDLPTTKPLLEVLKDLGDSPTLNFLGDSPTLNEEVAIAIPDLGDDSTLNDLGDSSTLNDLGDSSTLNEEEAIAIIDEKEINELEHNSGSANAETLETSLKHKSIDADIPDLGDSSTLNLKKLLVWAGELPEKELNQVIDALIGLRAASFPTGEETSQSSGAIELKMINGCGPYKYLRYWSGGRHRSVYMGKVAEA